MYWLDLLDGRISRMYFKIGPNENRPRIFVEPLEGHQCPASVALLPPDITAGEAVPTCMFSLSSFIFSVPFFLSFYLIRPVKSSSVITD